MTHTDPALEAAADQQVAETLDMLRILANSADFDALSNHEAAVKLAGILHANVDAPTLANSLANLLLSEVRKPDMPPMVTTDCLTDAGQPLDPSLAGVEIRAIGPERACRRVLAQVTVNGVPLVGFRGPMEAEKQPGNVRFYAYTDRDQDTRRAHRNRGRRRNGDTGTGK